MVKPNKKQQYRLNLNNDNELIIKVQKGDMEAFEQLLYRYDRQVLNIAHTFRNSEDDARDIYQEVFIRVFRGIKDFQFRSEFKTWLYRITTNVCITYENKKKKNKHDSLDRPYFEDDEATKFGDIIQGEYETDEQVLKNETSKYISIAINKLPAQQKLAFTLKYKQGYKIKEIAQMMNCAEGTVKRYLFTATNKMRTMLEKVI